MKTLVLNIFFSLMGLTLFTACNSSETKQNAAGQTETNQEVAGITYTCPMHPEVTSKEPGKCPQCGMNLEKAASAEHEHKIGEQH